MRITGGQFKGRVIKTLRGQRVRPTGDKVREALFNILGGRVETARVLDLFAGTGALGLEALSRGAKEVVFVEQWGPATRIIRENAAALSLSPFVSIVHSDFAAALKKLGKEGRRFEIVLADPPYRMRPGGKGEGPAAEKLLLALTAYDILAPGGILTLEHFSKVDIPGEVGRWHLMRRAQYGQTCLSFFSS